MIPALLPVSSFPYTGQQVIDFFTTAYMSDVKDYYVTEETRQEIYVHFKNKIKRGIWYTFKWKDIGGGVWQITGLERIMSVEISPKSMEMLCTWDDAVIHCSNLGDGWRLPTLQELQELQEIITHSEESVEPNVLDYDLDRKFHWTSDEYEYIWYNVKRFWGYNFACRISLPAPNTATCFCVRPVRDIK